MQEQLELDFSCFYTQRAESSINTLRILRLNSYKLSKEEYISAEIDAFKQFKAALSANNVNNNDIIKLINL